MNVYYKYKNKVKRSLLCKQHIKIIKYTKRITFNSIFMDLIPCQLLKRDII